MSVGPNLKQTNIQKPKLAPEDAEICLVKVTGVRKLPSEAVYNMEVADNHNFAVNGGLIVHNCMDAVRYMVNTMGITRQKREYQSIMMG